MTCDTAAIAVADSFRANITVEPVDVTWKITGLELLEEKRINPYANPKT